MTRDQIDALWHRAMRDAIAEGEQMTRYHFADLVAAAEREACARVCDFEVVRLTAIDEPRPALAVGICAATIRARGTS